MSTKKRMLATSIRILYIAGGESEIRTHGAGLLLTRFRGGRLQPLGHLSLNSAKKRRNNWLLSSARIPEVTST